MWTKSLLVLNPYEATREALKNAPAGQARRLKSLVARIIRPRTRS